MGYIKASLERSYAESFLSELERNENQYYLFVGKATPWTNENSPPSYSDTIASEYDVMNEIIGYKKLSPENVLFAIPRYEWVSGTVYDQYDDAVNSFDDADPKIFYVVTDENNIYKCLWNNLNAQSTVKPSLTITSEFETDDGYKWQYLATVKESDLPYELIDYVPVDFARVSTDTETSNQYNAQADARNASITRMDIQYPSGVSAAEYPNTFYSSENSVIVLNAYGRISVDPQDATKKKVVITDAGGAATKLRQLPVGESSNNYVGYVMRVNASTKNPKEINNYGVIVGTSFGGQSEVEFTVADDVIPFTFTPSTSPTDYTSIQILPYVKIVGDGSGAYSFPVMDSEKKITSINVIDGGKDYSNVSASVVSYKKTSTTHPQIRVIRSPKGGHGSNILKELNVKDVLLVMKINEYDNENVRAGGSYRQFGIIKNPVLNDGSKRIAGKENSNYRDITLVSTDGIYDRGDFDFGEGSVIIGTESYASAKPILIKSESQNGFTIKTLNTSGKFITRQDRLNDYELTVSQETDSVPFVVGETVRQVIRTANVDDLDSGFDVVVEGTVLDFKPLNASSALLTITLKTEGNFIDNVLLTGMASGSVENVTGISPRYGEPVWVCTTDDEMVSFRSRGTTENQKFYRIADMSEPYFDLDNTPSYSGLYVLHLTTSVSGSTGSIDVTGSSIMPGSFTNGQFVQQGVSGEFGHYASGVVYDWEYINPSRGRLYLTDVSGKWLASGLLGSFEISSVQLPQIDQTSGEVLYINNVRPITRTTGQEEEFRLRLGF